MSINLLDLARNVLGDSGIRSLSSLIGEDETKTQSAMDLALPTILGSLLKKASTPQGTREVFEGARHVDTSILGRFGDLISGDPQNSDRLSSLAGSLLPMLLGSNQDSLISKIAGLVGIGKGSSKTLLSALAPLLMAVLGKQVQSGDLGLSDFTQLLQGQKRYVQDALPAEMGRQLGLAEMYDDGVAKARQAAARTGTAGAETGANLWKVLVPLAILAVLGFGIWKLVSQPDREIADTTPTVPAVNVPPDADATVEVNKPPSGEVDWSGLTDTLNESFGNVTKSIAGISDVESAQAAVPEIKQFKDKLTELGLDTLSEQNPTQLASLMAPLVEKLRSAIETAYKIPGVEAILQPAMDGLMQRLGSYAVSV
ncbi:DUF937 domain-containing protein [Roseiconus nitratireducens]|uniref:DUF937 domain-containing protein n=1 Tax=Roseiconus nitratireducens TaxID=2605748 RepID=A0A5M6D7I9_9BACT|nr:DUF937 domain-containing protein [Roseiconus nitratireducens]KAA5541819.1 DUF937 domain-containing protein [Roseiconus nitratireducens]